MPGKLAGVGAETHRRQCRAPQGAFPILDCMLHYSVKTSLKEARIMQFSEFTHTAGEVVTNARIRWLPDESGEFRPYEMLVFDRPTFVPPGWERTGHSGKGKLHKYSVEDLCNLSEDELPGDSAESRRKSYNRARNKLFDLLMCTTSFDSFVTLTLDGEKIDRHDYNAVVKKLGVWLDNRVRRSGLVYALVPELHKDGAVHFHGLMNQAALKTERARSARSGRVMSDKAGRPIFNVIDFPLGFTTLIPLSGENARTAAAKYCYKYITKTHGEKVGGRYYLSGGNIGRPRYTYENADYGAIEAPEIVIGGGVVRLKKKLF